MGLVENGKDQLGQQNVKCRSSSESARKQNLSILNRVQQRKLKWKGHILRHESLLRDVRDGRMLRKATRGRKRLEMLSDVTDKNTRT